MTDGLPGVAAVCPVCGGETVEAVELTPSYSRVARLLPDGTRTYTGECYVDDGSEHNVCTPPLYRCKECEANLVINDACDGFREAKIEELQINCSLFQEWMMPAVANFARAWCREHGLDVTPTEEGD